MKIANRLTIHSIRITWALTATVVVGSALALNGCTRERPYEAVFKEANSNYTKALINTDDEYIYAPSMNDTPRSNQSTMPNWQGEAKIVKLRFTENSLEAYEPEDDSRFTDNDQNNKPVLSIPVKHVQYRCKENSVKECSNQEEENNDISWSQKSLFIPDFNKVEVKEVSVLPIEIQKLYTPCYQELGSRHVGHVFEKGVLNIEIEKTYRANLMCVSNIDSLSDLTFTVKYMYSFVKLNQLAAPGYQAISYPKTDENTFGFFTTEQAKLSVDNRAEEKEQIKLMNRWNPGRKEIVYFLSDNFAKPEYAAIKEASVKAVAAVNDGFKKAGVDLKITLKDPAGAKPGDLRNNMIVMVEDPQATGIIGYGPQVANPKTGEILNARVVMYLGSIKKFVRGTYDEVIEQRKIQIEAAKAATHETEDAPSATPAAGGDSRGASAKTWGLASLLNSSKIVADPGAVSVTWNVPNFANLSSPSKAGSTIFKNTHGDLLQNSRKLQEAKMDTSSYTRHADVSPDLNDRVALLSKYNASPAEVINFQDAVNVALSGPLSEMDLKPWDQLSDSEKEKIINIVAPYVWLPTLVHELGHNMGLRHNFSGSEDKDNFYTEQELKDAGSAQKMEYSSIMDYGYRTLNELRMMGKYDIAALRFGYNRQVMAADGKLVSVPGTLKELGKGTPVALKQFKYCTDENVGVNAGCRRFDEGTTYLAIAQNLIESYEKNYKLRNFRNGRRSFSVMDDAAYASGVQFTFMGLRTFFEVRDRIQTKYKPTKKDWKEIDFLKDLDQATQLSQDFFLKVIKTPDLNCAVATKADPNTIMAVVPASALGDHVSCFAPSFTSKLRSDLVVVAQGGKAFNSKKAPDSENAYVDQIDVRGIWVDKVMAAQYLLKRATGISSFDDTTGNYLDSVDGGSEKIVDLIDSLLKDQLAEKVKFTAQDGSTLEIPFRYSLFESHMIPRPMSSSMRKAFGLTDTATPFLKVVLSTVKKEMPDSLPNPLAQAVSERYQLVSAVEKSGRDLKEFRALDVGARRFHALPQNGFAFDLLGKIREVRILSQVSEERLKELLALATAPASPAPAAPVSVAPAAPAPAPAPAAGGPSVSPHAPSMQSSEPAPAAVDPIASLSAVERSIFDLGPVAMKEMLDGKYQSEGYYSEILKIVDEVSRSSSSGAAANVDLSAD
ncbi:MAG: zinc-dependent metalloprotease [Methylotenera sp.]|nr:zinc-dependent metalloprotease [Oligoflexia bacterium]